METLTFKLTLNESNQILKALGDMPYIQVVNLIQKIKQQAESQLNVQAGLDEPDEDREIKESKLNARAETVSEV